MDRGLPDLEPGALGRDGDSGRKSHWDRGTDLAK